MGVEDQIPFIGREDDLQLLRNAYNEARSGTPRVVAIVAESGFGKTRLAQEFYNWLSTEHAGIGGEGYWPDRLLKERDNLRVNPDFPEDHGDDKRIPFLWWGIRVDDPGQRNTSSSTGALQANLGFLRVHLAAYEKEIRRDQIKKEQLTGGGKTVADIAFSVGETVLDAITTTATFGLLGIGKAGIQGILDHRRASNELRQLDRLDISPEATQKRERGALIQTVLGDLYRLCKAPPPGFDPIPLVILIDDAQWLETDRGLGSFLGALMARAREEKWPLLVLLTCWRREWKASVETDALPGRLVVSSVGDTIHELVGVKGLESIIRATFPGLTDTQVEALSAKAEGVPRFLDEMLMDIGRRRKFFVDRDVNNALTDEGLAEVLRRDFFDFIADRLNDTPEHVRRALAIASTQGIRFSPRLVHRIADGLKLVDTDAGLDEGHDPHSFVIKRVEELSGEFRLRAYQAAAREDLANLLDETDVENRLRSSLEDLSEDLSTTTNLELELLLAHFSSSFSNDPVIRCRCIDVGDELIRRAGSIGDYEAAYAVANRVILFFDKYSVYDKQLALLRTIDAKLLFIQCEPKTPTPLIELVAQLRAHAASSPTLNAQRDLVAALMRLVAFTEAKDGSAGAFLLCQEAENISRNVFYSDPNIQNRIDFGHVLGRFYRIARTVEGAASTQNILEEVVDIKREVVAELRNPETQHDLYIWLLEFGQTTRDTGDESISRQIFEEASVVINEFFDAGYSSADVQKYFPESISLLSNALFRTHE